MVFSVYGGAGGTEFLKGTLIVQEDITIQGTRAAIVDSDHDLHTDTMTP